MEEIITGNLILEDSEIVNFKKLKRIINSGIEKTICKIIIEEELRVATGLFCNKKEYNMKAFITNNHVINKEYLNNKKTIIIEVEDEQKVINLELKRFKMTDENLDFTIIEILEEDNINNFLDIDEDIYLKDYKGEIIFATQFPGGDELNYSHGKLIEKKGKFFFYSLETLGESSGSPIILFNNLMIIGLHKGGINDKNGNKINVGIPISLII